MLWQIDHYDLQEKAKSIQKLDEKKAKEHLNILYYDSIF